jgi:hypothetical protein
VSFNCLGSYLVVCTLGEATNESSEFAVLNREISWLIPWSHELSQALAEQNRVPQLDRDGEEVFGKFVDAATKGWTKSCDD